MYERDHVSGAGSLKTLVYGDLVAAVNSDDRRGHASARTRHPNTKGIFAILSECVKHREVLRCLFERTGILSNEARLDPCLAEVLCAELLWGKGSLPGNSRPVQTLLAYESDLRRGAAATDFVDKAFFVKPRFARVNTLKSRLGAVCRQLKHEGLSEAIYDKASTTYADFLAIVRELKSDQFVVDYHVPQLLVFAPGTSFYDHPLYTDGSLILQDKASCLPVTALDLPLHCSDAVLDACAAPGMKTTQLAAATSGKVIAVERDPKRAETLQKMLRSSGASERTQVLQQDFLSVDPNLFPEVTYIVVDPSCSGSGMVDRQGDSDLNEERLRRLFVVQTKLLTHAM
jgi:putative methyltransferase